MRPTAPITVSRAYCSRPSWSETICSVVPGKCLVRWRAAVPKAVQATSRGARLAPAARTTVITVSRSVSAGTSPSSEAPVARELSWMGVSTKPG
jgi:hypothetical protein